MEFSLHELVLLELIKQNLVLTEIYTNQIRFRVDGTGGAEGAQAPPSFLDLYSKNFKNSQIRDENFFFYLVVPPHKNFASVHRVCIQPAVAL